MSINIQAINTVNKGFDWAIASLSLIRSAYNTAVDPSWQQVQVRKGRVAIALTNSHITAVKGYTGNAIAHLQVIKANTEIRVLGVKRTIRDWVKKAAPYGMKVIEGVAIALSWLSVGEEAAIACWQSYVEWVDEYIESCTEPEFQPAEIKLLTTPLPNENELLCASSANDARSNFDLALLTSLEQELSTLPQACPIEKVARFLQESFSFRFPRKPATTLYQRVFRPTI